MSPAGRERKDVSLWLGIPFGVVPIVLVAGDRHSRGKSNG
jgi:hypothetical protein